MILRLKKYFVYKFPCKFSTSSLKRSDYIQYCSSLVKKRDYENYLCLLLQKDLPRTVGFITRAFNIELAQIQETTTEMNTAKMRIEFWRRSINDTYTGRPPSHPVAVALALTLEQRMLSKSNFLKLIDIRERYLSQRPFMTVTDVEEYGEYSISPIFLLMLESLDIENLRNDDIMGAVSNIGKASSLITLIRSAPYFLQQHKVLLPTELCFKYSISQEDIIRKQKPELTSELIADIAYYAKNYLENVKELTKTLSKSTKTIFLPVLPYELFLLHLEKIGFDMYSRNLNTKQWTLPLKLWLSS